MLLYGAPVTVVNIFTDDAPYRCMRILNTPGSLTLVLQQKGRHLKEAEVSRSRVVHGSVQ